MTEVVKTREFHVLKAPKPTLEMADTNHETIKKTLKDMKNNLHQMELAIWAKPKVATQHQRDSLMEKLTAPYDFKFESGLYYQNIHNRRKKNHRFEAETYYKMRAKESNYARYYQPHVDPRYRKVKLTDAELEFIRQRPRTVAHDPRAEVHRKAYEDSLRATAPAKLMKSYSIKERNIHRPQTAQDILQACRASTAPATKSPYDLDDDFPLSPARTKQKGRNSGFFMTGMSDGFLSPPGTFREIPEEDKYPKPKTLKDMDLNISKDVETIKKEAMAKVEKQKKAKEKGLKKCNSLETVSTLDPMKVNHLSKFENSLGVSIDNTLDRFTKDSKKAGEMLKLMAQTNQRKEVQDFTMTKAKKLNGQESRQNSLSTIGTVHSYKKKSKGLVTAYDELSYLYQHGHQHALVQDNEDGLMRTLGSTARYQPLDEMNITLGNNKTPIQVTAGDRRGHEFFAHSPTDVRLSPDDDCSSPADSPMVTPLSFTTFRSSKSLQQLKHDNSNQSLSFTQSPNTAYKKRLSQKRFDMELSHSNRASPPGTQTEKELADDIAKSMKRGTTRGPMFPVPDALKKYEKQRGRGICRALPRGATFTQSTDQLFPMPMMNPAIAIRSPAASRRNMRPQSSEVSFAPFRRGSTTKSEEKNRPMTPSSAWLLSPTNSDSPTKSNKSFFAQGHKALTLETPKVVRAKEEPWANSSKDSSTSEKKIEK